MPRIAITRVENHEPLARYVTEEELSLIINENQIKGDAFVPTPNLRRGNRLEKSVIRYGERTVDQMHEAGKTWASYFKKKYNGLLKVHAVAVREVNDLNIDHTPKGWESLHSDIIKWFPEAPRFRIQAELIAQKSTFHQIT